MRLISRYPPSLGLPLAWRRAVASRTGEKAKKSIDVLAKLEQTHYHARQTSLEKLYSMSLPPCPKCNSEFVYQDQEMLICPECAHEWKPSEVAEEDQPVTAKDANGTLLADGDKVTLIKDLKVKGSSQVLKIGTKALVRRIVEGKDHELDCRVDGAGEMMVTAKFVKKA